MYVCYKVDRYERIHKIYRIYLYVCIDTTDVHTYISTKELKKQRLLFRNYHFVCYLMYLKCSINNPSNMVPSKLFSKQYLDHRLKSPLKIFERILIRKPLQQFLYEKPD